jgi:hypothetical protein
MSTTDGRSSSTSGMLGAGGVDMKPEVLIDWCAAYMVAGQAGTELPQ